jgi:hypothetical protein
MSLKNPLLEAQLEQRRQQLIEENRKELINSLDKPSEGLGDTIEKVFEKTGIKHVAKKALGEDCGCNKRKETLNKLFPYKNK